MKRKLSVFSAALLTVLLAIPSVAATTATTPVNSDLNSHMKEAKQASFELRKTAERLHAITRGGGHSWQSHSSYLNTAREDVNQLGRMLNNLEKLKPYGPAAQQIAIEKMRPQLLETANALTSAIELLNDRRNNIQYPGYREAVRTVSERAASLHQNLDAVLDYEAARSRLNSLELLPPIESGS